MTNKEIASLFNEMAGLMELHGENEFRIKSYANSYLAIRKLDTPLVDMSPAELTSIRGIGKTMADKILEIKHKGSFDSLEELRAKTPQGVREMLSIKGIGPKKLISIWKELGVESPGELLYACRENRLLALKGFGNKIQEDLIRVLEFHHSNSSLFLLANIQSDIREISDQLKKCQPGIEIFLCGEARRMMPVLDKLCFLISRKPSSLPEDMAALEEQDHKITAIWKEKIPLELKIASFPLSAEVQLEETGGSEAFLRYLGTKTGTDPEIPDERTYFQNAGLAYIPPECRDLHQFEGFEESRLVDHQDIRGVIHNHSTYSDGNASLRQMAEECIRLGYEYLVISDHSKSAFYANGLSIERVEMQWREIDVLNRELAPFRIYKSIESDILSDGSLDYPEDILSGFELVIASIHSNLKMSEEKAMERLLKAIGHPATRILGHPTGRLLLSRQGYPIDHKRIIDACAEHRVVIELNANPMRLDLDWNWIPYAQERGVMISINPDAHNLNGIRDIGHGVHAARKGGLLQNNCLNCYNTSKFNEWISSKA